METIKFKAQIGSDGILRLELPTGKPNASLEVLVVMQETAPVEVDEMGYPIGYFESTYGALADDPLERPDQGDYEQRDEIL